MGGRPERDILSNTETIMLVTFGWIGECSLKADLRNYPPPDWNPLRQFTYLRYISLDRLLGVIVVFYLSQECPLIVCHSLLSCRGGWNGRRIVLSCQIVEHYGQQPCLSNGGHLSLSSPLIVERNTFRTVSSVCLFVDGLLLIFSLVHTLVHFTYMIRGGSEIWIYHRLLRLRRERETNRVELKIELQKGIRISIDYECDVA